jgi:S1-C subfamily serine protease
MTTKSAINEQQRRALVERVACYTVGIASNENTCIGTGTLVAIDGYHLVITAEHVIKDADVQSIRFWCRPPAPIIEKAAKNLSLSEIGRLTEGRKFPIETIITDSEADLAAIKIRSTSNCRSRMSFIRSTSRGSSPNGTQKSTMACRCSILASRRQTRSR